MEIKDLLQFIGLSLNLIGFVLVFFFGISPFILNRDDGSTILYKNEDEFKNDPMQIKRKRWKLKAKMGFYACISGILLQLFSYFF